MLTATSNNFLEYQSKLRRVLLSKGLRHICDPYTKVLTRPTIKVEKGAEKVAGFVAPTAAEHKDLLIRAEIVQNHEVVLLMSNSLDFPLHHLLDPHPVFADTELGRAVYLNIDRHFSQSNEWTKSEILHRWDTISLTNPRDTYSVITRVFHEAMAAGVPLTHYLAAVKFARLLQPLNQAYIPVLQDVMRNPASTLDSIWPTVVQTASLLRLSGPSSHAHSATVPRRADCAPQHLGDQRTPCTWCGAPGHQES
jgi:hypothetical protein